MSGELPGSSETTNKNAAIKTIGVPHPNASNLPHDFLRGANGAESPGDDVESDESGESGAVINLVPVWELRPVALQSLVVAYAGALALGKEIDELCVYFVGGIVL